METSWLIVGGVLGANLAGGYAAGVVRERRLRRLARDGRLECSLRRVSGEVDGLGGRWHHGTVDLAAGTITFRRGRPGGRGVRPGSHPVIVPVDAVDGERRPGVRESWNVSSGCVILEVRSGDAVVEWAVLARQKALVRRTVGVSWEP